MTHLFSRLALLAALALPNAALSAETLRLGLLTPPPHQWSLSAQAVADQVAKASDGNVQINVFPAGQLGNEAQMLQQLQTGALDIAFLTIGELASRDAEFGALLAPYLVKDIAGAHKLLSGPAAQELLARTRPLGLEGLGFGSAGMRVILLSKPAESGADLKGRKIRTVPLPQELDFWTRTGATPVPIPLPALYDALANGQIDGTQIDFEGSWNSRYFDLASEILASDHMIFPLVAVASGKRWNSLSEADRALIKETIEAEMGVMLAKYAEIDADYRGRIEATGFKVRDVGPEFFGTAVEDWYTEWRPKTPILEKLEAEAKAQ